MKTTKNIALAVVCGIVFSAVSTFAQDTVQGVATVVSVVGEAQYQLGDGQWHPLVVGKMLGAGATLRSGTDATVDIVLGRSGITAPQPSQAPSGLSPATDFNVRGYISYTPSVHQNTLRMTGGTVLKIDKLTMTDTGVDALSDTELDLKQGRIFNSVKKLSPASQYLVKIPTGVAGVRGTLFGIGADGWVAVLKDSVLISIIGPNGTPTTVTVDQGNVFNPQTGQSSPMSPGLMNLLSNIMLSLRSHYPGYYGFIHFRYDQNNWHISPTTGYYPHH